MTTRPSKQRLQVSDRTLGAEAFAAITAVEGLRLSAESRARLASLRSGGLTLAEQRAEVLRAYMRAKDPS